MKTTRNSRAGYSLVEVTLALLVVAIGLTATFALFPEGLKATRAAVNDAEIGMFAEYVFTTLDLTAAKEGGNYNANPGWRITDTDQFISLMLSQSASDSNFQLRDGGRTSTLLDPGLLRVVIGGLCLFRVPRFLDFGLHL